jgi:2-keto-3-deoxy-L-rhamnonate aldolase RhmA
MISIRELLKKKPVLTGTMVRISRDPAAMRILRNAGMDLVLIDMEHSSLGVESVSDLILAANGAGLATVVRVPEIAKGYISRVLDLGASGVLAPMVSSPEQAQALVRYTKYPPLGARGVGSRTGNTDYDAFPTADLMRVHNGQVLAIAQFESKEAVESLDAIAAVPGLDALLVGPNDLSVSLGLQGDTAHPQVKASIAKMIAACRARGLLVGAHMEVKMNQEWLGKGLQLAISSTDTAMLHSAAAAVVKGLSS